VGVPLCKRLDTCGGPPRIPSLCDRRRVTTREECRITVGFDRFSQRRRWASVDAYIPYQTRQGELAFLACCITLAADGPVQTVRAPEVSTESHFSD